MMQDVPYTTQDIGLVIALVCSAQPIKTMLWKDEIAYFLFADRTSCEDLEHRYYLGQLPLDARTYYDTLRGMLDDVGRTLQVHAN